MSSTDIATVKKFLNNPDDLVPESLAGLEAAHSDLLTVDLENQIVVRKGAPVSGKVALVSGGGSGHEPLHGGFVGIGMLDAACPGAVFTSPVPDQMLAATKAVDGGAGVVHIVKNYTGDVLNFRMAAELAEDEGIQVESVLTNDDVAVEDSLYTAGRRGVGVTVLVEKIAGAKAEAGGTLAEVAGDRTQGERAGAKLRRRTDVLRHADLQRPDLRDRTGRDGIRRRDPRRARPQAGPRQAGGGDRRADDGGDPRDLDPPSGSNVLAFVNGLGGTPLIELYVVYNELTKQLAAARAAPRRGTSSGTTSRASRWPACRSRCSRSTTS